MISGKITTQVMTYKVVKPRKRRERYNHPKRQTTVLWILDLIERRGGMTAGQIAKALFERAHPGMTYDPKLNRGYWGTNLHGQHGILRRFCTKVGSRWVRNNVDHGGHPFARSKWQATNVGTQLVVTYAGNP